MTDQPLFLMVSMMVLLLWAIALLGYLPLFASKAGGRSIRSASLALGWLIIGGYITWLWVAMERPPMRTLGETRLWYCLFLPLIGFFVALRWRTKALMAPVIAMAIVFLLATALNPESFDKELMPALRSPWFIPHVVVYMVAYAALGISAAVAGWFLVQNRFCRRHADDKDVIEASRLVHIGFPFLTAGLIFGAYWAKEAWGHYWSWDPKETWAFLTWAIYLIYIHMQYRVRMAPQGHLILLAGAFLVLLGCWFGVNSLPTAQQSVHTYQG